jgi:biopolymer transport protein ExbD
MPKIKMPRTSPSLDMTPMVDLAFLLVTFFMLTAQFRPEESVAVDTPSSMSQSPVPEENLMTIVVDTAGKVYWDMTDNKVRMEVLNELGKRYNFGVDEDMRMKFANLGAVGLPIQQLPDYLALDNGTQRKEYDAQYTGIPTDSTNNQLAEWIRTTQLIFFNEAGVNPLVALKADGNTNYARVNEVIKIFQGPTIKINRFKMITDLEESRL